MIFVCAIKIIIIVTKDKVIASTGLRKGQKLIHKKWNSGKKALDFDSLQKALNYQKKLRLLKLEHHTFECQLIV